LEEIAPVQEVASLHAWLMTAGWMEMVSSAGLASVLDGSLYLNRLINRRGTGHNR
jgi:hypothetical protein